MSRARDIRAELEPGTDDDLIRLAERLEHARPVPTPAFRGLLRRMLVTGGAAHARPARLRLLITGYAGAGGMLLMLGAVSALGVGPLGA